MIGCRKDIYGGGGGGDVCSGDIFHALKNLMCLRTLTLLLASQNHMQGLAEGCQVPVFRNVCTWWPFANTCITENLNEMVAVAQREQDWVELR